LFQPLNVEAMPESSYFLQLRPEIPLLLQYLRRRAPSRSTGSSAAPAELSYFWRGQNRVL